jgi:hypothetical protein
MGLSWNESARKDSEKQLSQRDIDRKKKAGSRIQDKGRKNNFTYSPFPITHV